MLGRRGATVLHGPVLQTSLLNDINATVSATNEVTATGVDFVVLTTGIGTRSWFGAVESSGLDVALRERCAGAVVLARGLKARSAGTYCGLKVDWHAPGETGDEVVQRLQDLGVTGKRIAVQRDGGDPRLAEELRTLGARVIDVPVYRCGVPADPRPALRLIDAVVGDRVDAVTFTCRYAVSSAFALAPDPAALTAALDRRARAVAVGPLTASALRVMGVRRVMEPQRTRLGSMVQSLICELTASALNLHHEGRSALLQGNALIHDDGSTSSLTTGERRLLVTLLGQSPSVVAKADLAQEGSDPHATEAAIGRLRSKLGPLGPGIRAVPRRGYTSSLRVEPDRRPDSDRSLANPGASDLHGR